MGICPCSLFLEFRIKIIKSGIPLLMSVKPNTLDYHVSHDALLKYSTDKNGDMWIIQSDIAKYSHNMGQLVVDYPLCAYLYLHF